VLRIGEFFHARSAGAEFAIHHLPCLIVKMLAVLILTDENL